MKRKFLLQFVRTFRFCLLIFLFSFAAIKSSAQSLDEQVAAAEKNPSDSLRVILLNKIAVKDPTSHFNESVTIINKSLKHAGKNFMLQAECYQALAYVYRENFKTNQAIDALKQAIRLYENYQYTKGLANTYDKMGSVYKKVKESEKAITAYQQSIDLAKKCGDWEQAKKSYKEASGLYSRNGQNPQALSLLLDQLSYAQSLKPENHLYLGSAYMDLTYNQFRAGNIREALSYALQSYEHAQVTKDDYQLLDAYNTIGACYNNLKRSADAIQWYEKAIAHLEKTGSNKLYLASILANTGIAYYEIHQNEKGLEYKKRALDICKELNDAPCLMNNFIAIGIDLVEQDKNYREGIIYLKQAEALSDENGSLYTNKYIYEGMYKAYQAMGDYKTAFDYMSKYLVTRDSILSEEKQKQMGELEARYESDKKQQQIELLSRNKRIQELQLLQNQLDLDKQIAENKAKQNSILLLEKDKDLKTASLRKKEAEAAQQQAQLKLLDEQKKMTESENRNQRYIIYSFIAGLVLLVVLLFNIYRSYRQKQKANMEISRQKAELQLQKDIVDEKNKEIMDSINYAKRLQEAILPPARLWEQALPQSFVLYKPKDVVAGDFYFMEQNNGKIVFAAADCTGHGVPGAMVSVVCSNALTRAVKEYNLTEPAKILDKVRELVIETFEKSESDVKDGMDISLCVFDKQSKTLEWAGANNPLWIFSDDKKTFTELKPDKQPIGKTIDPKPFSNHKVKVNPGDLVYLFTDGYADQFGGDKGKKFKSSNFRELLSMLINRDPKTQMNIINNTFEKWRGDLEQVDDVCVIGIRI